MTTLKKQQIKLLALIIGLAFNIPLGLGQQSAKVIEDFKPSTKNQPGKEFPKVDSEGRVQAQILAPNATHVLLDIGGVKYEMFKSQKTAHEWLTWRSSLYEHAQLFFKN